MPQIRGKVCNHRKGDWDSHESCLSCCGCTKSSPCAKSITWSQEVWKQAASRRTHASRAAKKRSSSDARSRRSDSSASSRSIVRTHSRERSPLQSDSAADLSAAKHPVSPGKSAGLDTRGPGHSLPGDVSDPAITSPGAGQQLPGPGSGYIVTGPGSGHASPGPGSGCKLPGPGLHTPGPGLTLPGPGLPGPGSGQDLPGPGSGLNLPGPALPGSGHPGQNSLPGDTGKQPEYASPRLYRTVQNPNVQTTMSALHKISRGSPVNPSGEQTPPRRKRSVSSSESRRSGSRSVSSDSGSGSSTSPHHYRRGHRSNSRRRTRKRSHSRRRGSRTRNSSERRRSRSRHSSRRRARSRSPSRRRHTRSRSRSRSHGRHRSRRGSRVGSRRHRSPSRSRRAAKHSARLSPVDRQRGRQATLPDIPERELPSRQYAPRDLQNLQLPPRSTAPPDIPKLPSRPSAPPVIPIVSIGQPRAALQAGNHFAHPQRVVANQDQAMNLSYTHGRPHMTSIVTPSLPSLATPSNPNTIWIRNADGSVVPENIEPLIHNPVPSSGLASHLPNRPPSPPLSIRAPADDSLMLEGDNVTPLPTTEHHDVSVGNTVRPDPTPSEPDGSEVGQELDQYYLAPINQVYEAMFATLDEETCPRPPQAVAGEPVTATERCARKREPDRVGRSTRTDLRLPIGSTARSVFQSLELANKVGATQAWKAPKDSSEPKPVEGGRSYKPPVPDPSSGLDLSKIPHLDPEAEKLKQVAIPSANSIANVPYSMLETWELRERKSVGLANQLDLMAATAFEMSCELTDAVPEELRALLIHQARTTQLLAYNAASSMAEMLRLRRDMVLETITPGFMLDPGITSLRTAPFTANTLFGGRIPEALEADKDQQLHASLARGSLNQRPGGVFKQPAAKSPAAAPNPKKGGRKNNYTQRSIIPSPAPNRKPSYKKGPGKGKFSKAESKDSKPSPFKGGPPKGQP